jgi:murein DD-endopeptidase MepM/ murein hydrolase activator NlpD
MVNRRSSFVNLIVLIYVLTTLAGCAGRHVPSYGFVAPDAEPARSDDQPVFIPANAPSIPQGFDPEPAGVSRLKPRTGHEGIDIASVPGTPVLAVADGIVVSSYFEPFYGNRVVVNHGRRKDGKFIKSYYLHLKKRLVREGERIYRGQQIGELGNTGILASYPHLHFEIRIAEAPDALHSVPLNPHLFWADGPGIVTCFDINRSWPSPEFRTTYPVPCLNIPWH